MGDSRLGCLRSVIMPDEKFDDFMKNAREKLEGVEHPEIRADTERDLAALYHKHEKDQADLRTVSSDLNYRELPELLFSLAGFFHNDTRALIQEAHAWQRASTQSRDDKLRQALQTKAQQREGQEKD
jgi:hypothetical protein